MSYTWDIPLFVTKIGVVIIENVGKWAILAQDEELQEKNYNQKCFPECQLLLAEYYHNTISCYSSSRAKIAISIQFQ